jgi:FMN reductase
MPSAHTVGLVVDNPKVQSRTLVLAKKVAAAAADAAGLGDAPTLTVDLAELGPRLFDWSSPGVQEAVDGIRSSSLVVVASPTYKASYTGLLKSFLDWFGNTSLEGVTVIPVMTGAGNHHALAVEVHLRPMLVDSGPACPLGASMSPRPSCPRPTRSSPAGCAPPAPWYGGRWQRHPMPDCN